MDLIFLVYGFSFLVMGLAIVIRYDHDSRLELANALWLLAVFGFVHGLREWLDLWRVVHGDSASLALMRPIVLLVSYIALFEFGRRLARISLPEQKDFPAFRLLDRWIHLPLLVAIAVGTAASEHHEVAMDVWSRYLLGLPGAVLAGLGFLSYGRRRIAPVLDEAIATRIQPVFTLTGLAFIAYGLFGGAVVPGMGWFPASVINQDTFLETLQIPVQLVRALCAVLIAIGVGLLLKVFHLEGVKRLHESEKRFHGMADNAQDAIVEINSTGIVEFWNRAAETLFGYTALEATGRDLLDLIIPLRFQSAFRTAMPHFSASGDGTKLGRAVEVVGLRRDGSEIQLEVTIGSLPGPMGRHAIGILRDVTERREIERQLKLGSQVIAHALDGIIVTDQNARIQLVNPAFTRITGYSLKDVAGQTPGILRSGRHTEDFYTGMWQALEVSGEWEGEIWNRRRDGAIYPEWISISAIRDNRGRVTNYVGIFSDITRRKAVEQQLERMAFFDPLTGLPNRALLRERLDQALRELKRNGGHRLAVFYLDLDLFKQVNDRHGHTIGDLLLTQVGERLTLMLRDTDTVARLGGDEFAIVMTHVADAEGVGAVAGKIVSALSQPFVLQGHPCQVGASIGIALAPDHGTDADALIVKADQAMYEAKRGGRNQYRLGTPATMP